MSFFRSQNHAREVEAEDREARRLAHLRESRTARFERLLDPRAHIGADTNALEQQSRMRALQAEAMVEEKKRERLFAVQTAEEITRIEKEQAAQRRAKALQVAADLAEQEKAKTARTTWDLEDPLQNRKGSPVRQGLDDPRLGMSSAQVFVGEDVAARQRALLQQAQVRTWTAQMVAEKEARKAAVRAQDEAIAAEMVKYAQIAGEIDAAGVAEQRRRERSAVLENESLIADKRAQRQREKEESKVGCCGRGGACLGGGWGWERRGKLPSSHPPSLFPLLFLASLLFFCTPSLSLSLSLSLSHTHTHTHTYARAHAHARTPLAPPSELWCAGLHHAGCPRGHGAAGRGPRRRHQRGKPQPLQTRLL